jgi:hypothetical protein
MAKSIQELLNIRKTARAVPTRNVPAIDWPLIVEKLQAGETLTFKTDCKFALPKNPVAITEAVRACGYTGNLKVRHPFAEVVVLDPDIREDEPVVERSGRAEKVQPKRPVGRPRKNPLAAMRG